MELFTIHHAERHQYPMVVSIPHSGIFLPKPIAKAMRDGVVLPNMDWFLKELYSFLQEMGVTIISSNVSRYVIDLNRDKEEDINGENFWTTLVYTHNTFGTPLYEQPLFMGEIRERIAKYYDPYHMALEQLIRSKLKKYNRVFLLDLHSFSVDFFEGADEDISLSNYDHQSSTPESIDALRKALAGQGYKVAVNTIRGRFILKNYKRLFGDRMNCIQMELRYSRYIEDRYYGEEELTHWNEQLFLSAQAKLKAGLTQWICELEMEE